MLCITHISFGIMWDAKHPHNPKGDIEIKKANLNDLLEVYKCNITYLLFSKS